LERGTVTYNWKNTFKIRSSEMWGMWWCCWLRHCATIQKVVVLIPDGVIWIFIDIILPATVWPWGWLSLQQKWVRGIFPGGKCGRCIGQTTLPPSYVDCLEIWEPQPSGTLWPCPGL
jgi:hypothetical protein